MRKRTFTIGARVGGRYVTGTGNVLDYSGVIVDITTQRGADILTVRFRDGIERTITAHPDSVVPMEPAIAAARSFRALSSEPLPTARLVYEVLSEAGEPLGAEDLVRTLWVLLHSPEDLGRPA